MSFCILHFQIIFNKQQSSCTIALCLQHICICNGVLLFQKRCVASQQMFVLVPLQNGVVEMFEMFDIFTGAQQSLKSNKFYSIFYQEYKLIKFFIWINQEVRKC
eukprot:TRINITY_DN16432_c0_g1_i1.p4 TRINITY_DN16432_c0_g1~~TRINITY_DN16432_c0_g1_i1.p4  ORF type:complete len:104 (+),score=2.53 TRINITY_DN16432_c0_g1_i1:446-757(+)